MTDAQNGNGRTVVWRVIVGITMPALGLVCAFLAGQVWDNAQTIARMDERLASAQLSISGNAKLSEEVVAIRTRLDFISQQIQELKTELLENRGRDNARH